MGMDLLSQLRVVAERGIGRAREHSVDTRGSCGQATGSRKRAYSHERAAAIASNGAGLPEPRVPSTKTRGQGTDPAGEGREYDAVMAGWNGILDPIAMVVRLVFGGQREPPSFRNAN